MCRRRDPPSHSAREIYELLVEARDLKIAAGDTDTFQHYRAMDLVPTAHRRLSKLDRLAGTM